jgi:plastocyanin
LRHARKALPLGLLTVVLLPSAAQAASTVNISADNFAFTPSAARVRPGDTALWTNVNAVTNHTSTSDTTMPIAWDSGTLAPGGTFSLPFTMAGTFSYHCTFHGSIGMVGTVSVPLRVVPASGPPGTMFTISLATANPTGTLVFDVQKKDPGGVFQDWKLGVTTKTVVFDSTGLAPGTYQFKALLRDTASGKKSLFSSAKGVTVT